MERDHSRPGSFRKVKRRNSYGKNFAGSRITTPNLQNRRSELKALIPSTVSNVYMAAKNGVPDPEANPVLRTPCNPEKAKREEMFRAT